MVNKAKSELVIYFSTHSAELIQKISPKNLFLIENDEGIINVTNPCYPNYAIRNLYVPNGFDFILLVEDELTKTIVQNVINKNNLAQSKLCCVLPAGGCTQMLALHRDMVRYNALGAGKHIISIFDGDVKTDISKKKGFEDLPKCFLPIPSVEKYLLEKCIKNTDRNFIKIIGDKYFPVRSLKDILNDYKRDPRTIKGNDSDGKNLYKIIISNVQNTGMSEDEFIKYLADDIYEYEKPTKFVERLKEVLS